MNNRDIVYKMLAQKKGSYHISLTTGIKQKEVYHHQQQYEQDKHKREDER